MELDKAALHISDEPRRHPCGSPGIVEDSSMRLRAR